MDLSKFAPLKMVFGLVNVVQAQSLVRDALKYVGSFLAAKGFAVDSSIMEGVIGLAVAIIGTVWSQYANKQSAIVATAATVVPIDEHAQRKAGVDTPLTPAAQ